MEINETEMTQKSQKPFVYYRVKAKIWMDEKTIRRKTIWRLSEQLIRKKNLSTTFWIFYNEGIIVASFIM